MAMPKLINELPTASLGAGDLLAARVAGVTSQVTITQLITEAATFTQSGTGAVARTVQGKLREWVTVTDFDDVDTTGVSSSLTGIQAAIAAASKGIIFPEGTYNVGTLGGSANYNVFDLTAKGDGFQIKTVGKVLIKGSTGANVQQSRFFLLSGNSDFYCEPIEFEDDVDATSNFGAVGFWIDADTAAQNINLSSIKTTNMLGGVICEGGSASVRAKGIKIGVINSTTTRYPFNCQNNGDDVEIGLIHATDCVREYFVYGINNHKANIVAIEPKGSSGHVNISRSIGGLDTKNLRLKYTSRGDDVMGNTHALINHIDLLGGEISNITLDLDVETEAVSFYPLRFVNYNGSGSESAGASSNVVTDIVVRLICDANANDIDTIASYTDTEGRVVIEGNVNVGLDDETIAAFNQLPNGWTAAGDAPSIENGTYQGQVHYEGGKAKVSASFVFGSSTTFGTGAWGFTVPFVAAENAVGSVWAVDTGTQYKIGTCLISKGGSSLQFAVHASSNTFNATNPHAWADTDELRFSIEVAVKNFT